MAAIETSAWRTVWRRLVRAAVAVFVVWHLFFLFVTNTKLDAPWVDAVVKPYEKRLGLDQCWGMFTSPLWRNSPFPAVRVHFTDGSSVDILSPNEPKDVTNFFRFGGARQRKYEHHLIEGSHVGTPERPALEEPALRRLTEDYLRRWRAENPGDGRVAESVTLLRRTYVLPPLGEPLKPDAKPTLKELGSFTLTKEEAVSR